MGGNTQARYSASYTVLTNCCSYSHRVDPLDETRRGTPLPHLPPELWVDVIRNATAAPGFSPLAPSSTPASFLTPAHHQINLQRYHTLMQQKLVLSLVSQHFHGLVNEVLYEFIWISRSSQASRLAHTLITQAMKWGFGDCMTWRRTHKDGRRGTCGDHIRRLHIETPSLMRCNPADLRVILDFAPFLQIYEDHHGMRRNAFEEGFESPEQLIYALVANAPNKELKALTLTNYDDYSFHFSMGPLLNNRLATAQLQFLELHFVSSADRPGPGKPIAHLSLLPYISLPALRTLKVTLDNNTFLVLSNWSMPSLTSLSVMSADFSYASSGFTRFFEVHGQSLKQLELGHSSSSIEEHYLTAPVSSQPLISLGEHCPNLKEFICSADAEWNWQNPDWIAPHVLLPFHPNLELIGIRDIDKRIKDDLSIALALQQGDVGQDDDALFSLREQLSSLLREEAFPRLQYIRDLSPEASWLRCPSLTSPSTTSLSNSPARINRCRLRGIWLEDCDGVNMTLNEIRRRARDCGVNL
ncbi:hypothetical protein DL96DRAFT_1590303 [Flagelloscypha sp. PMI_526]|nr:hypothetical protein DL96DRAFT_1590303 [Flagelloscypha sp. PMI_526]